MVQVLSIFGQDGNSGIQDICFSRFYIPLDKALKVHDYTEGKNTYMDM